MSSAALRLDPRPTMASAPATGSRMMTAAEVAVKVCEERRGRRWVIDHMGPEIGSKPGNEWFFREHEARAWWERYVFGARSQ